MTDQRAQCNNYSYSVLFIVYTVLNFVFMAGFLVAFVFRFAKLKPMNKGTKYKELFPKKRILFLVLDLILSLVVVIFNMVQNIFPEDPVLHYVLQGGGPALLNSIVLVFQLLVLRQELSKQQKYTRSHTLFFINLLVFSIIRFALFFGFNCYSSFTSKIMNITFSGGIVGVSTVQLAYWLYKSQDLPQFRDADEINITCELQNETLGLPSPHNLHLSIIEDEFPFLVPSVAVQDGQIRVTLQLLKKGQCLDESNVVERASIFPQPKHQQLNKQIKQSPLSSALFNRSELKHLYVISSRFPLHNQIDIAAGLPELSGALKVFLEELLHEKSYYQPDILKALKLQQRSQEAYESLQIDEEINWLRDDPETIYCSIQVFKCLSISDNYQFCIRAAVPGSESFVSRSFDEFESLHQKLRVSTKIVKNLLELPPLPRMSFPISRSGIELKGRQRLLEVFLRIIANDEVFMEEPTILNYILSFLGLENANIPPPCFNEHFYIGLTVKPREVIKAMAGSECVTFYEFILTRDENEVRVINKRYSEFQALDRNLKIWAHNSKSKCSYPSLPSLIFPGKSTKNHSLLVNYLQNVILLPGIGRVYSANVFFKASEKIVRKQTEDSESFVLKKSRVTLRKINPDNTFSQCNKPEGKNDSNFSQIINDLGNELLD